MPASCFEARSYVLKNATVPVSVVADPHSGDLEKLDLTISDGGITKIEPAGSGDPGLAAHDCDGGLVLPAFVDTHTHLDKGHMWPRTANPDGSWLAALNACRMDHARELPPEDIVRRMDFALRSAFAHGTAAIRTHLDSVPPRTETVWQVFDEIRERWAGRIELQAVSLIGTDQMLEPEILDFVAKRTLASSGIMGGSVAVHPEARKAVFAAVEKAGNLGLDLDFHCDETGDPEANALRHLADAIIETGFPGKAVAGHCCVLAVQDAAWAQTTIERAVEAGIGIVSLPMCNMFLQDRWTGAVCGHRRRSI
ncbi:MAG: amidohydrolase family protein, partial [Pseudomonadota bacterium]